MNKTLLIGNGLNRLSGGYSWGDVLRELSGHVNAPELTKRMNHTPFSILYEEIAVHADVRSRSQERILKQLVSQLIKKMPHNDYHQAFMEVASCHVLTTNYDYNLETATAKPSKKSNCTSESRYSVFRKQTVGNKNVWRVLPRFCGHFKEA